MRQTSRRARWLVALLAFAGCTGEPALAPPETFDWHGRAIAFAL